MSQCWTEFNSYCFSVASVSDVHKVLNTTLLADLLSNQMLSIHCITANRDGRGAGLLSGEYPGQVRWIFLHNMDSGRLTSWFSFINVEKMGWIQPHFSLCFSGIREKKPPCCLKRWNVKCVVSILVVFCAFLCYSNAKKVNMGAHRSVWCCCRINS